MDDFERSLLEADAQIQERYENGEYNSLIPLMATQAQKDMIDSLMERVDLCRKETGLIIASTYSMTAAGASALISRLLNRMPIDNPEKQSWQFHLTHTPLNERFLNDLNSYADDTLKSKSGLKSAIANVIERHY